MDDWDYGDSYSNKFEIDLIHVLRRIANSMVFMQGSLATLVEYQAKSYAIAKMRDQREQRHEGHNDD